MPEHEVLLKTVEAQWIASVRKTIDRERMGVRLIGRRLQEGFSCIEQNATVWGIMVSVGVAMLGEVGAMKALFVPFLQGEIGVGPEGGGSRDTA